jgi:hypothetical protein
MFGRGICEKYQSRDEKFPEPNGEGNVVSGIPLPNMIYLTGTCFIQKIYAPSSSLSKKRRGHTFFE